mmetsp:Transcript_29943/g.46360  ORF Transcript_29943/g.46360 Transcript_29943/m.46360 type:complete len:409 (+) Transcript_29943:575-1801(+)
MECLTRQDCQDSDVYSYYSPCTTDGRTKFFNFSEPKICNDEHYMLHESLSGQPCADCNPGLFRDNDSCLTCPPGSFSPHPGAISCQDCPEGTAGKRQMWYTQFDAWDELDGMSTYCSGDCATDEWRLLGDDIDSGEGHGPIVDSVLQIDTELVEDGTAFVNYSVVCKDFCKIAVVDVDVQGYIFTRYLTSDVSYELKSLNLTKGVHQLQIVFSKYLENTSSNRQNRMIIHELSIEGVTNAGATSCESCPAGYFSSKKSEFCTPCPPGTYSPTEGASQCTPCSDGFYTPHNASTQCLACGANTNSNPTKTECDLNGCTFTLEDDIMFNLSKIPENTKHNEAYDMYGPVFPPGVHSNDELVFYLSPCQKEHSTHSCLDAEGNPLSTFACKQRGSLNECWDWKCPRISRTH